jgi:folate-binding protein YgfZ
VDFYFPDGGSTEAIEAAVRAAGGEVATAADYEIWRIEHGIPRFGLDITAENLPQETGLVSRAVSFDKGCYTGQEVVARIHYRGQVNRHLRGIRPAHPYSGPPVPHGTELTRDGRAVGATASWCSSPRLGPIGLAYVRRELTPGDTVEVSADHEFTCIVTELPFTST